MENTQKGQKKQKHTFRIRIIQYVIRLTTNKIIQPLVMLLITIQALQIIAMSIVTPLSLSSFLLQYFQYVANILYPDYYLRTSKLVYYIIPILFCVSISHIILIIYTYTIKQSRLIIIVHYIFIIITTILTIPYLTVNISILNCNQNNPLTNPNILSCYQGYHVILLIFSCVNILWIILCTIFVFIFFCNKNPFVYGYYCTTSNTWVLVRFLLKLIPIVFTNINPTLSYAYLYTVGFAVVNGVYYMFRLLWPYYRTDQNIDNWVLRCEIVTVFVTGFVNAYYFIKGDNTNTNNNIGFVMSIVLGVLCSQVLINISAYKKSGLVKQIFIKQNNSQQQQIPQDSYLQFFYSFFSQISQKQTKQIHNIKLFHIYKIHKIQCLQQSCPCSKIKQQYNQTNPTITITNQQTKQIIYTLIVQILKKIIKQHKKNNTQLKIVLAYVLFYKLNNKIKAIHMMSDLLESDKINIGEQIAIRKLFIDYYQFNNNKNSVNKYIQFSEKLWRFQRYAENAAQNCRKYWVQLIQQDCQITKIWKMANIIAHDKQNLKQLIDSKLLQIFPNNLHTLNLYCQLLTLIYYTPQLQLQKYKQIIQSTLNLQNTNTITLTKQNQILFLQNQHIGVLCAAQFDQNLQFLRVSSNIFDILAIRSMDLINKNINILMHQIYQQFHDNKIKRYMTQSDYNIKQRNSNIFIINGKNKLIQCIYKVQIIPSLKYGIQLICFIKQLSSNNNNNNYNTYSNNNSNSNRSNKQNYLMYYYIKDNQQKNNNNESRYKSGDIIHMDSQIQKWLFGQQLQQNTQKYQSNTQKYHNTNSNTQKYNNTNSNTNINTNTNNANRNMRQLFPQWDHINNKMLWNLQKQQIPIFQINLIHQDQLNNGEFVKYLCIQFKNQSPFLTIDPIIQADLQNSNKKRSKRSSKSSHRQSLWSDISYSRFNINSSLQIANNNYNNNNNNNKINEKQNNKQLISKIPQSIINIITFVIIGCIIVLSVLSFKTNQQYLQIQQNDFKTLQYVQYINTNLYEIVLNIQKQLNKQLNSSNSNSNSNSISSINTSLSLNQLNNYGIQIYNINSINLIDTSIIIPIYVYVDKILQNRNNYTFNNALSFLITAISLLWKDINDLTAHANLYTNIQAFYNNCLKITEVSNNLKQNQFGYIRNKQISFQVIQLCILFIIVVFFMVRVFRINNFTQIVVECYQQKIDANYLLGFVSKCEKFIQKIRGCNNPIGTQTNDKQDVKVILKQFQCFKSQQKVIKVNQKSNQQLQNQQKQEQQQKLVNLRKRLTFQSRPSKCKYFAMGLLIFICWIAVKFLIKIQIYETYSDQQRLDDRNLINSHYVLSSQIQRLLFNLALKQSSAQNTNFINSLTDFENKLIISTSSKEIKQKINIEKLIKCLALIKSEQNISFFQIQEQMKLGQQQILTYASKQIQNEYSSIAAQESALSLILNMVLGITALLFLRKLIVTQQQILIGSNLMLQMIKQEEIPLKIVHKRDRSSMMMSGMNSIII